MPKVKLSALTLWGGNWYQPGESVEVPEDLMQALGLKPATSRSPSNKAQA